MALLSIHRRGAECPEALRKVKRMGEAADQLGSWTFLVGPTNLVQVFVTLGEVGREPYSVRRG